MQCARRIAHGKGDGEAGHGAGFGCLRCGDPGHVFAELVVEAVISSGCIHSVEESLGEGESIGVGFCHGDAFRSFRLAGTRER